MMVAPPNAHSNEVIPLPQISIEVHGAPGDAADLYDELQSRRLPGRPTISAASSRDGTLGLLDTILAIVNTVTAVAGLAVAVTQWRKDTDATVTFHLGNGKSVVVDRSDQAAIDHIWKLLEDPDED
jgi:hypothetical protein